MRGFKVELSPFFCHKIIYRLSKILDQIMLLMHHISCLANKFISANLVMIYLI